MAELLLKVGAGAGYEEGDIICALNRRHIRCAHAQQLCHVKFARRNNRSLLEPGSIAQDWFEFTHEYRFERVSKTQIARTTIQTGNVEVFGSPDIDVPVFVARRMQLRDEAGNPRHRLFGTTGREIWYGGKVTMTNERLNLVWAAIEGKTTRRESEPIFRKYPLGTQDLRSHFAVPVEDFDDSEASRLVASEIDDTDPTSPVIVQKRLRQLPWRAQLARLGVTEADVRDRARSVDRRDVVPLARTVIRDKPSRRPAR